MIPKIIHYCWFGQNEMPKQYRQYIEGWKKFVPIMRSSSGMKKITMLSK